MKVINGKSWYEVVVWSFDGRPSKIKGHYPVVDRYTGEVLKNKVIKETYDFSQAVENAYLYHAWTNTDPDISIAKMPEGIEVWRNGHRLVNKDELIR